MSRRKWLLVCLCKHRKYRSWKPNTHFLFWEYFHCFTGSCTSHCSPFASPFESRHTNHCVGHEVGLAMRLLSRASVLDSLSATAGKNDSCHMISHSWRFCLTDNVSLDLSQWKMIQCTVIGVIPIVPSRAGHSMVGFSLLEVERCAVPRCGQSRVRSRTRRQDLISSKHAHVPGMRLRVLTSWFPATYCSLSSTVKTIKQ